MGAILRLCCRGSIPCDNDSGIDEPKDAKMPLQACMSMTEAAAPSARYL
jgi:hypothetical protein